MADHRLTPLVESLPSTVPFVGPETQERSRGRPFRARIGANESVFGPSPRALQAMQAAAVEAWKYCDPENYDLKQALARHHGVAAENIVVGEGIDGLFGYAVRMFVEPGVAVATSLGAYPTFNFHVEGHGGRLVRIPYRGAHEDAEALLAAAGAEGARLLYLANPDNPMGSHHPAAVIEDLVANLPEDTLLILDEAYADLAPEGAIPRIPADHPQVIRFRTFSKGYGMAGARVGYAIAEPALALAFDKVRDHFGMAASTSADRRASMRRWAASGCGAFFSIATEPGTSTAPLAGVAASGAPAKTVGVSLASAM